MPLGENIMVYRYHRMLMLVLPCDAKGAVRDSSYEAIVLRKVQRKCQSNRSDPAEAEVHAGKRSVHKIIHLYQSV